PDSAVEGTGYSTGMDGIVARPIDPGDVPAGTLHIGYLKGRVLPVAAAKFLDDIIQELRKRYPEDLDI
ncbi:MAG: hypothetical protein VW736_12250, partial [Alphaproteobacteria bacterium]